MKISFAMGTSVQILIDYIREFIPSHKVEFVIVGIGTMLMSICLLVTAHTSGLSGPLTYMTLTYGAAYPGLFGGAAILAAALVMKPVEMP